MLKILTVFAAAWVLLLLLFCWNASIWVAVQCCYAWWNEGITHDFGGGQPEASWLTSWGSGGRGRVHFQKSHSSALLIFNYELAEREGISSAWPSFPFESPPHPKRNHLPGLWVSPAAGKIPSRWLVRQRQAHNLRHCTARWQTFSSNCSSGSSPHQLHPSLLGRQQQSPLAVLIIPDLGREPTPIRRVGAWVDGATGAFLKGRAMGLGRQASG